MLEVKKLKKKFGSNVVLNDISFNVSKGDIISIVGPSGSGKSTLINLIPRFFDVSRGSILVDGVDIRDVKVNTALPKRERILDFIRQIGNPYCYRHGKYVVRVSFADTDISLEDRLEAYIRTKG